MTSIYRRALGADFDRLHPRIQERFGITSADGRVAIGRGTMDRVWHGRFYTLPFLYVGTWRNIMLPEHGQDVPFEIQNWAYRDGLGRETVTWLRTFHTRRPRRFDAYMIYSEGRSRIVDYLAPTSTLPSISPSPSINAAASASGPASNASTRVRSRSAFRPSSRAWPTCASGSTTPLAATVSK